MRNNLGQFVKGGNHKHSEETKAKISASNMGKKHPWSEAQRAKFIATNTGRRFTEEHKRKLSESLKGKNKGKHPTWEQRVKASMTRTGAKEFTGFASEENRRIRQTAQYKQWREFIFKRDDWTCVECRTRGGKLEAHHIRPFSLYPQSRFLYVNGVTLCLECHKKTDTYMGRIKRYNKTI